MSELEVDAQVGPGAQGAGGPELGAGCAESVAVSGVPRSVGSAAKSAPDKTR